MKEDILMICFDKIDKDKYMKEREVNRGLYMNIGIR